MTEYDFPEEAKTIVTTDQYGSICVRQIGESDDPEVCFNNKFRAIEVAHAILALAATFDFKPLKTEV